METINDARADKPDAEKLIPEWGADHDDQIVAVGLIVLLVLALGLGWARWGPNDLGGLPAAVTGGGEIAAAGDDNLSDLDADPDGNIAAGDVDTDDSGDSAASDSSDADADSSNAEATTTTTAAATTTVTAAAQLEIGDVRAAVAGLPGEIGVSLDGSLVTLEGFVANQAESSAAERAASAVEGVEAVTNNLVLVEPAVLTALTDAGVENATVEGAGTDVRIEGVAKGLDVYERAVAAANNVPGVGDVVDALTVEGSALSELVNTAMISFDTSSNQISADGQAQLDAIAAEFTASSGTQLQLNGWADVDGDADTNQLLSERRAEAVASYLIAAGVPADRLLVVGNGETDRFDNGDSEASLAANRVVTLEVVE